MPSPVSSSSVLSFNQPCSLLFVGVTLSDLRAELAGEEGETEASSLRPHRISRSEFVALALDIEEQQ